MAGDRGAGVVTRVVIAAVIVYYIVMNKLEITRITNKTFCKSSIPAVPICRCVAAAVLLFKSSSWEICRFCGKKLLGLFYSFGFFGPKEEDPV